jgi:heat-inducible transcriptional repressor
VTNLLALVTAPPIETATIHRIEVLQLQPQVTMVVVITSTGGVTKRVISYEEPVDSGLVAWAASYLNEALGNMDVGSRMMLARLNDATLSQSERDFLATLAPAFTELEQIAENNLFMEGAARLAHRAQCLPADRRGEPDARAPVGLDRGRQLRAGPAQPGRGVGDRPGAHGLPGRDRRRSRRRA